MSSVSYNIRYADESIEDIKTISQYYKEINSNLVNRFKAALLSSESDLLCNPFAYSKVNYKDFRRITIKRFPYKITYRVENNTIYIFSVSHFARSNHYLKKRLKK